MNSNTKTNIQILLIVGIVFSFLLMIPTNLNQTRDISYISPENEGEINLDNVDLRPPKLSEKIHINNNWSLNKAAGICTGNGTYSNPYVIEDLVIDGEGSGNCITIENSSVYFRIENCSVFNSGDKPNAGIYLVNVSNSQLIDNNCSSNFTGINLYNSNNNKIVENIVNNNSHGIYFVNSDSNEISRNTGNHNLASINLRQSSNNTIYENTANINIFYGIFLYYSNNHNISRNIAIQNGKGIFLYSSDNNTISGNFLFGNEECVLEEYCEGNVFENNDCGGGNGVISGYHVLFQIGIISVAAILITKKLKKNFIFN